MLINILPVTLLLLPWLLICNHHYRRPRQESKLCPVCDEGKRMPDNVFCFNCHQNLPKWK